VKRDMAEEEEERGPARRVTEITRIVVVYDNHAIRRELKAEWGFSCWIEAGGKVILFDTGGDGDVLLGNMKALGLDPTEADAVFISHNHWDHTGGLEQVLELNGHVPVQYPSSFPRAFAKQLESLGGIPVPISHEAEIMPGCWTTGPMGSNLQEHSLVLNTPEEMIVVTGCAHPGIVKIVETVRELTGPGRMLVLGGFHLLEADEHEIGGIIADFKRLGVTRVGPSHCSGERARRMFREDYGVGFLELGVGYEIMFGKQNQR